MVAREGSHAIALAGDAALPEFAEDAVQKTLNAFGRIDILVNNAGVQYLHDSIRNITSKQLFDTFAVNVYSAFFMSQACLKHMRRGGAIMCVPAPSWISQLACALKPCSLRCCSNTSSVAAYKGRSDMLDYAAAKGALISFTYSLAQSPEVLEKNIRVNAVAPGHTISPMVEATYSRASRLHPAALRASRADAFPRIIRRQDPRLRKGYAHGPPRAAGGDCAVVRFPGLRHRLLLHERPGACAVMSIVCWLV